MSKIMDLSFTNLPIYLLPILCRIYLFIIVVVVIIIVSVSSSSSSSTISVIRSYCRFKSEIMSIMTGALSTVPGFHQCY